MTEDGQAGPDHAALLERLRATVAERQASGQYPPGLEADLDAHFQRIVGSRRQMPRLATMQRQIEAARRASRFSPDRIPTTTRLPGGALLHKAMSRLFLRQAHGILLQVQEFADRALEALEGAASLAESPDNHQHADLIEQVDAHSEALAALAPLAPPAPAPAPAPASASAAAAAAWSDLDRRIRRLEQAEAARRWHPWFGRNRFDAVFDGGRRQARAQAASNALGDRAPVFALSVAPEGARLAGLVACSDASLGGVVALGADEVLTAQEIVDLVALAFERLAVDGRLLISSGAPEPVDPEPPALDPTLGPALPARYVTFMCEEAGFATVAVERWPGDGYLIVATR